MRTHNQYRTLGGYADRLTSSLETDSLRRFAPSIFAGAAHIRTSHRYSFLPTSSILEGMAGEGWLPVAVQEQVVRDESRQGFQKHMVRFAHRDDIKKSSGERAEIVVINSHDRSSAYQIHAAIFRFVCCNGLVVSDATFSRISITHMGFSPDKIVAASLQLAGHVPALMDGISRMKAVTLTEDEQLAFAEAAAIVRFGALESAPVRPRTLLQPRRAEDSSRDVWTTFNTVQENAVKGGQRDHDKRKADGSRMPRTRPVKGIDSNVSLNKALWHLAEKIAELKNK
jgi:Domain of unknown function (DUF932)